MSLSVCMKQEQGARIRFCGINGEESIADCQLNVKAVFTTIECVIMANRVLKKKTIAQSSLKMIRMLFECTTQKRSEGVHAMILGD